jgi:Ca2+-binding EF-hand superfamily protein
MPACPPEILKKFEEHGFEKDWVQGEYDTFMTNYPNGKISKAEGLKRLEGAAKERFPNADPKNVAEAVYPAFDPENKGEVDFLAAAKGLAILFCARIEIRAQLFFSIVDESGDGKINKAEMKKFLNFVNETQGLGLPDTEVDALNDEIFTTLGKSELTLDDVRDVVAARWGA